MYHVAERIDKRCGKTRDNSVVVEVLNTDLNNTDLCTLGFPPPLTRQNRKLSMTLLWCLLTTVLLVYCVSGNRNSSRTQVPRARIPIVY